MKSIYFQLIGGAGGDMLLAALIDAGCPLKYIKKELQKLGVSFQLTLREREGKHHTVKNKLLFQGPSFSSYKEIKKIVDSSLLQSEIKNNIKNVYERLAEVEATVHKLNKEQVHFHHLGEIDALLEISGFFIALDYLDIHKLYVSPFPISCPAPATLELLKHKKVYLSDATWETVTPTAAALLCGAEQEREGFYYKQYGIGWGCYGDRDYLTAYIVEDSFIHGSIVKVETNIDDMNPQGFELLLEMLYKQGAKEVYIEQVIMKKSRPGVVVNVLCEDKDFSAVRAVLFRYTSTFGIRYQEYKRDMLNCSFVKKDTKFGKVKFRVAEAEPGKKTPEYSDCLAIAQKLQIPLWEVYRQLGE